MSVSMWDGYVYINEYVQSDLSCCFVFQIPLQLKSKATLGPKNGVYIILESR